LHITEEISKCTRAATLTYLWVKYLNSTIILPLGALIKDRNTNLNDIFIIMRKTSVIIKRIDETITNEREVSNIL
jgi:hypothetical protein